MKKINRELIESVNGDIHLITLELARPKEDVVGIPVCITTQTAIEKVLLIYLEAMGINPSKTKTLNDLIILCVKQNKSFSKFDLSPLSCRCETSGDNPLSYCTGVEKINACFRLLSEIREFVFAELKLTEQKMAHYPIPKM